LPLYYNGNVHVQIPVIQKLKPDLILSGETREWEEAGMEYLVKWLQPKVPGIKIVNIPSNPFTFV